MVGVISPTTMKSMLAGVIFIVVWLICVVCWLTVVGCGVVVAFVHNLHVCNMVVTILDLICDSVSMSLFCYPCHFSVLSLY